MNCARKQLIRICAALLILFLSVWLVCYLGACSKSPEDKFVSDIEKKVDCLIKEMRNARGTWKQKTTVISGNRGGTKEIATPRMLKVTEAVVALDDHFQMVPLTLLLGFQGTYSEEWGARVRDKVEYQRQRLKKEVERLEKDVRDNPKFYPNSQIAELSFLGGELAVYGWTKDGRLYVVRGRQGIILDAILCLDIDAWLEVIKSKVEQENDGG